MAKNSSINPDIETREPQAFILYDAYKVGTLKQCQAMAHALALSCAVHPVDIRWPWMFFPTWLWPVLKWVVSSPLPTLPKGSVVIGGGRRSAGVLAALKRKAGDDILAIQIFKGDQSLLDFDVLIAPHHDLVSGKGVLSMTGALVWMDRRGVVLAGKKLVKKYSLTAQPQLGVIVGGNTACHHMTKDVAHRLCGAMRQWQQQTGGTCLVTTSRRTPRETVEILDQWTKKNGGSFWPWGAKYNPYAGILGAADAFLVTQDSISMAAECAYFGKPLYLFHMAGGSSKFFHFFQKFIQKKHGVCFSGIYKKFVPALLDESENIALRIKKTHPSFFEK